MQRFGSPELTAPRVAWDAYLARVHQQHVIQAQFGFLDRPLGSRLSLSRVIHTDDDQAGGVTARRFHVARQRA
jgi:hypothetical protein